MPEIELDAEQLQAIESCTNVSKRLVAVTGEAGTGKTTIIKQACDNFAKRGVAFALAAPTGKAARRIREATGYHAMTIHKMLGFNKPEVNEETGEQTSISTPSYGRNNAMPYDVVIVDEYAMVPTGLHRDLVSAIKPGGALRVFGDIRQLPPIENAELADPTSPFQRCLDMPNTYTLTSVYRQAEGNGILEVARRIARGMAFSSNNDVQVKFGDAVLFNLYRDLDESDIDWRKLENQLITPARKSDIGTIRLNSILQARFNPDAPGKIELPRNKWEVKNKLYVAVGDKVVCTVNSYDLRDYDDRYTDYNPDGVGEMWSFIPCPETKQMLNGEVGLVINIGDDGTLEIDFGDRVVELPPRIREYHMQRRYHFVYDPRKVIDLAYALTTHKCQGSQYDNVNYIMAACAFFNLSRPNFYTGVTRASKSVRVFTDQRAYGTSLRSLGWKKPLNKK